MIRAVATCSVRAALVLIVASVAVAQDQRTTFGRVVVSHPGYCATQGTVTLPSRDNFEGVDEAEPMGVRREAAYHYFGINRTYYHEVGLCAVACSFKRWYIYSSSTQPGGGWHWYRLNELAQPQPPLQPGAEVLVRAWVPSDDLIRLEVAGVTYDFDDCQYVRPSGQGQAIHRVSGLILVGQAGPDGHMRDINWTGVRIETPTQQYDWNDPRTAEERVEPPGTQCVTVNTANEWYNEEIDFVVP